VRSFFTIIFVFFAGYLSGYTQTDTLEIEELTIISQRVPKVYSRLTRLITVLPSTEINAMPAQNYAELLESLPNVDIRQRGAPGVQADINLSGGSFDQSLILLNGIPMNDPQSGHHSFNLPVAFEAVNRIEILNGSGGRVLGPNAFSGAVNFIAGTDKRSYLSANISGGQYGYFKTGISGSVYTGKFQSFAAVSTGSSSGYIENTDYRTTNYYYHGAAFLNNTNIELQAGYQDKSFGANSFYTPKFPNQYEQLKNSLLSLKVQTGNLVKLSTSIYWKRNKDRFELFRSDPPVWYDGHNYHLTNVYGIGSNAWIRSKIGKTSLGVDFRQEDILSNILGNPLNDTITVKREEGAFYTRADARQIFSAYLEQSGNIKKFSYSTGFMINRHTGFKWKAYGGIDLSYSFSTNHRVYLSVNQSYRLPTFTDLYYKGPVNVGNPYLKPEEAITVETAYTFSKGAFQARSSVFFRKGTDIIDWARYPDSLIWKSKNITELKTMGFSISGSYKPSHPSNNRFYLDMIQLSYTFQSSKKQSGEFYSRYAMDYLKHKADLVVNYYLTGNIYLNLVCSFQDRAGSYTEYESGEELSYDPLLLVNSRISWTIGWIRIFGEATNLLNQKYYDHANVPVPGIWLRAGLSVTWNPVK